MKPQMDTDRHGFLYKEETHRIIGCAFEVLNTLGHGLLEKPYENALAVEFQQQGIPYPIFAILKILYSNIN